MPKDAQIEVQDAAEPLRTALEPAAMIAALDAVGVDRELIVEATGADDRTVRRWANGESEPRSMPQDTLDRIRIVALYMLQRAAMPARFIGRWLRARNLELGVDSTGNVLRPIDAVKSDDLPAVFAAINALIRAPRQSASEPDGSISDIEERRIDASV